MATSSLPPVTSLGSGSNLDLQGILDSLQANQEQQLTLIKNQQTRVSTQISAYGTLQQAVETLQTAAQKLADASTYSVTKASIGGGSTAFTAKTSAGATPATYNIKVKTLAVAEQLKSGAIADRTTALGSGGSITVTLSDGTSKTVDISKDTSLNGIAKAINADDGIGVTATILNDGSGKSYLLLTSKETGEEAAVTKVTSTNATVQRVFGYDSAAPSATEGMQQMQAAADATLEINGIAVTSGSNTVDDIIDGVTLTLNTVTTDPVTMTISSDTSGVVTATQSFVTAYNTLKNVIASMTKYDASTETASVLTGDSTTRTISSSIAGALRVLSASGDTLRTIQDLGITTDPTDGTLDLNLDTLDSTHLHSLNDSLAKNPKDVATILQALGTNMSKAVDGILGDDGLIATRTEGLSETLDTLQDTYDRTSARIDADIANIRAQFVQLDAFVAQMNSTSSYLTQQFAALSNQNK